MSWTLEFLTDFKKNLDFVFFPLGLSNFGLGAWFHFDKGQSNLREVTVVLTNINSLLSIWNEIFYLMKI